MLKFFNSKSSFYERKITFKTDAGNFSAKFIPGFPDTEI